MKIFFAIILFSYAAVHGYYTIKNMERMTDTFLIVRLVALASIVCIGLKIVGII